MREPETADSTTQTAVISELSETAAPRTQPPLEHVEGPVSDAVWIPNRFKAEQLHQVPKPQEFSFAGMTFPPHEASPSDKVEPQDEKDVMKEADQVKQLQWPSGILQ